MYKYFLDLSFQFSGIYIGLKLLGHTITLCLTFWGNFFQIVSHGSTILPIMKEGPDFSTTSQILVKDSSYVLPGFLPAGCLFFDRRMLKSPTIIFILLIRIDSSVSLCTSTVFASCTLMLCCLVHIEMQI